MTYVDGYVLPVPKKNLPAYRRMAQNAGKVWRDHGALQFRECVGDDLKTKRVNRSQARSSSSAAKWWSFRGFIFKLRAHRDSVNAKVMKDRQLAKMMDMKAIPFDSKRMVYGGFKVMVDA